MAAIIDPPKPLEFGVFLPPKYQWLDATGAVDYLNSHSYDYLSWIASFAPIPEDFVKKAPVINWHWISAAGNLDPINASSGPPTTPTKTFQTAPQLDYILVPGPDPEMPMSTEAMEWLKAPFPGLKALLTVCSASLYLTQTGLLDGVHAATNKFNLKILVDGGKFEKFSKIWSAAGVTSGLDLSAEFAKVHFDKDIVEMTKNAFEYCRNFPAGEIMAFTG